MPSIKMYLKAIIINRFNAVETMPKQTYTLGETTFIHDGPISNRIFGQRSFTYKFPYVREETEEVRYGLIKILFKAKLV